MSALLLTMGPQLGIVADIPALRVGDPGTVTFRAIGSFGQVRWSIVGGNLPVEWGAIVPAGDEATISTAEALQWGDFEVTVRAVDDQRTPVVRTFRVWVEPEAIVVTGGSYSWTLGSAVPDSLAITGGTGDYVLVSVTSGSFPAGVTPRISGAAIVFDGIPSATGDASAELIVTDSRGAMGIAAITWEVIDPVVFVAGAFTAVGGTSRQSLVKLMPNGTINTGFAGGVDSTINVVAIAADKKVLVAGAFSSANGVSRANFAVFNEDGTLAAGNPTTNNDVYAILPHPNGKCVIGGLFTSVAGTTRNRLARLNSDYTLDTSWNPNLNGLVWGHWAYPDGSFLIGGDFTRAFGASVNRLIRVKADGTRDTSFTPSVNYRVYSIHVQPDGKILIGGAFNTVNGVARYGVARLHADGTLDTGFVASKNTSGAAMSVATDASGRVYVVAPYYQGGAVPPSRDVVRMSPSGVIDWAWAAPTEVNCLVIQPDGKCLIGGSFISTLGVTRNRIARLNEDGTLDMSYNPSITGGYAVYWILSR